MFGSCKYYSGACYTKATCTSISTPLSANTDDLKRLFCQNMYDALTKNYCTFSTGAICGNPVADCTAFDISGLSSGKADFC
jgi:hypothetical protein